MKCPELESLGGLSANLQSLEIYYCDKLIGGRMQWGLQGLNALSKLRLRGYSGDDLDSFPEEALLPSTLSSLEIRSFENLKAINYKGLKNLTYLAELKISFCRRLQCLPKEGLPPSLFRLTIYSCPALKERCKKGEYRSKISHLQCNYQLECNGKLLLSSHETQTQDNHRDHCCRIAQESPSGFLLLQLAKFCFAEVSSLRKRYTFADFETC